MKTLVVITLDLPSPEFITTALEGIDPPRVPFFAGDVRIVADPNVVAEMIDWLDED